MSHLPIERLAALADEPPSQTEAVHLAACAECARERAMFRSLADLANGESARIGQPLTKWESIKPVLVADGVIDTGRGLPFRAQRVRRPWLQAAAAVLLMTAERAKEHGLKPLARFITFATAGVDPDIMGVGPIKAVPKALKRAGLTMNDVKLVEFNEAFAAQVVAVVRDLQMTEEIVNVNGGAIALGHPLGATGAKLTTQLVHELGKRGGGVGLVTMCIGGGMGAAGLFEVFAA